MLTAAFFAIEKKHQTSYGLANQEKQSTQLLKRMRPRAGVVAQW